MRARVVDWISSVPFLRQVGTVLAPRLCYATIMDRQQGFGPYSTLSFDVDFPRDVAVLPRLVEMLQRHGVVASFACIGRWVRQHPVEHRVLAESGQELLNHTETHPNLYHPEYDYATAPDLSRFRFNEITPEERRREIAACHQSFIDILGRPPAGFRTPHFGQLHVDDVYPVLAELGYRFSSSVMAANPRNAGVPYRVYDELWEFPVSPCPNHPFGVLDSWHAIGKGNPSHPRPGALTAMFQVAAARISADGGYLNAYLDPKACVDSGELERILCCLLDSGLPIVTYGDLVANLETCGGESIA